MIGGNGNTQNYKNTLSSNSLFPLINKPTRVTQHSSTIIDNIYCNTDNLADTCKSGIFRLSISDHYAIFCVNHNIHISNDKCTMTKREFTQRKISRFYKCVEKQSWISINSLDVQSAFSWFQRVIDLHIEDNFPKRTFTMTYKNLLPWLTEKLRNQIKDKNAMHTMVILNPGDQQLRSKYKQQRSELTSNLRNSELKYHSDELGLNKSDLYKTWGTMKKIIGKNAIRSKRKIQFQIKGKSSTNSGEIANSFNDFFVSIGPKLANNIVSTIDPMSYVTPCNNSIVIPPVTLAEVRQTILSLKTPVLGGMTFPHL